MDSFNELWQVVSDYLRQTNSESIYNVWFSELEPISFDGSRAVLMTTAEFKRRILAQKFGGTLHSAFLNALGLDVDVEFIAPGEGYSQSDSSGSAAGSSEIDGSTRASNYFENTFDTFVVGASNKSPMRRRRRSRRTPARRITRCSSTATRDSARRTCSTPYATR